MILSNGSPNPNQYHGSSGENYEEMKERIKSFGSIKEILKNEDLVMSIIAYNGDRHFFATFIDLVNEALAKREIWEDDLTIFNSGKVADAIVNISETARIYGNRREYPSETRDKLNYLALLKDDASFAASFTHPEIIEAIKGNGSHELVEWMRTREVPVGGMSAVVVEMIKNGATDKSVEYLSNISYYASKYVSSNKDNSFTR